MGKTEEYFYLGSRLSPPYWTEVVQTEVDYRGERVMAPTLYGDRAAAERELREYDLSAGDEYLRLVEVYGEEMVNRAFENSPPLEMHVLDREDLLMHLEDLDAPCVVLDGEVRGTLELVVDLRAGRE